MHTPLKYAHAQFRFDSAHAYVCKTSEAQVISEYIGVCEVLNWWVTQGMRRENIINPHRLASSLPLVYSSSSHTP